MTQRIIKISDCETCKEVLLQIDRDEVEGDLVKITAWHETDDGKLIQVMNVFFEDGNLLMKERYIADFSEISANEFANSFDL